MTVAVIIALLVVFAWLVSDTSRKRIAAQGEREAVLKDLGAKGEIHFYYNATDFSEYWLARDKTTGRTWYFPQGTMNPHELTSDNIQSVDVVVDRVSAARAVGVGHEINADDELVITHAGRSQHAENSSFRNGRARVMMAILAAFGPARRSRSHRSA